MIVSAATHTNLQDWFMLGIAIDVSLILFITSLKIDRTATSRLLILLDEDRRQILDFLAEEKTFGEIRDSLALKKNSKSNLAQLLSDLRRLGFVHESNEYTTDDSGKKTRVKKFIRSF